MTYGTTQKYQVQTKWVEKNMGGQHSFRFWIQMLWMSPQTIWYSCSSQIMFWNWWRQRQRWSYRKHTPAPASALMISSSVMRILHESKVKAQSTKFQRTRHSRAASLIFNLHWSNLHFIHEKHVMCLSFVFNHAIFYNDVPLPVQRAIISMRQLLWGCQTSAQFQCAKQLNASFPSNAKMTHLPRHDLNSAGRHSSPK